MAQPPVQPFDDPALKAALGRALGRESAPPDLRARVLAATSGGAAPADRSADTRPSLKIHRRGPLYRLAVAAILIIGFGGLSYQIWQMNQPPEYTASTVVPPKIYQAMVDAHTARLNQSAGSDTVPSLATAPSLGAQVNRPVFVADLQKDGWKFEGGGVRDVAGTPTPHFFFPKGKAAVSVFSLPASVTSNAKDGTTYDTTFANSPIAGFVKGAGLFCIVGSSADGSLQLGDV